MQLQPKKETRNLNRICPLCFMTLDPAGWCLFCKCSVHTLSSPSLVLPMRIVLNNKYFIGKVLGEGGFGITYKGLNLQTSRTVAIKEFFPKGYTMRGQGTRAITANEQNKTAFGHWLNAFIKEAKLLASIKHLRGVVRIMDFFATNGTAYIVTDFLDGDSLRTYMNHRGGKLPWQDAIAILRPVLDSLSVLHEKGVIHNDISPENIMMIKRNVVKLIDFGAASFYKETVNKPYIILKPGFSPIECYRANTQKGPFTDVYQVAATLYNMITGTLVPEAKKRDLEQLIPPNKFGIGLPPIIEHAIVKALSMKANDRYQSVPALTKILYNEMIPRF